MGAMTRALLAFGALAASLSPAVVLGDDAFEHALSLASEKRYAEAREVLNPLLEREPGNPRARLLHGILRARAGRVSEAIDIFEALRRDHPEMSEPYNNLAVLYAVEGRLDDARTTLLAALERGPDAVVYANLGDVYTKLARHAYRRARDLDPGGALSDQETDTTFPLVDSPAPSMQVREAVTAPRKVVLTTRGVASTPPESTPQSGGVGKETRETATEWMAAAAKPPDVAVDPRSSILGGTQVPGTVSVGGLSSVVEAASTPDAFCVRAGGFDGRRAVADAALWLRSQGAEIIEVRHEEQEIAGSYRVYLPPLPTRGAAAEKLREIRERGVRDVAIIRNGDLANGISFGIYNKADNVHRRVAALGQLGYSVRSAAEGVETVEEYAIRARAEGAPAGLDAAWTSRFPERSLRIADCG